MTLHSTTHLLPIIGITTFGRNHSGEYSLLASYIEAVRRAGGVPLLVPPAEQRLERILQAIDGLILTGGGDIEPQQYGGEMHPAIYKVDPERDASELALAQLALNSNLPILGICRGLQILSVVSGASLISHVPDVFGESVIHREEQRQPTQHSVRLMPGSRLADITGTLDLSIVSWHHQAIRDIPPGWGATAHAPDGLVEALEHLYHPWAIAVQWHPEMSIDDPTQHRIFEALISAARLYQQSELGASVPRDERECA